MNTQKLDPIYTVVVGNIGTVYEGDCFSVAEQEYYDYVELSRENYGRAAGESVTLFIDGEHYKEYNGTLDDND